MYFIVVSFFDEIRVNIQKSPIKRTPDLCGLNEMNALVENEILIKMLFEDTRDSLNHILSILCLLIYN